jgi:hypothetical protein
MHMAAEHELPQVIEALIHAKATVNVADKVRANGHSATCLVMIFIRVFAPDSGGRHAASHRLLE